MTEYEKMKANLPFNPDDPELTAIRTIMRREELAYNRTGRDEMPRRAAILKKVLGRIGENSLLSPDIHFDYGCNTYIGKNCFANVHLTVLDVMRVVIGDNVLIGPNVIICTPTHPIDPEQRLPQKMEDGTYVSLEYAKPITIEDQVWIGAGAILNPGVTIGRGSVIGSGSVVTRDIPAGVVAAGVPCRILHKI